MTTWLWVEDISQMLAALIRATSGPSIYQYLLTLQNRIKRANFYSQNLIKTKVKRTH